VRTRNLPGENAVELSVVKTRPGESTELMIVLPRAGAAP
jgi:hypothetical protein